MRKAAYLALLLALCGCRTAKVEQLYQTRATTHVTRSIQAGGVQLDNVATVVTIRDYAPRIIDGKPIPVLTRESTITQQARSERRDTAIVEEVEQSATGVTAREVVTPPKRRVTWRAVIALALIAFILRMVLRGRK